MKSLHIMHPSFYSKMVPIPLVLYLTEELMADEAHTPESIAELLVRDVAYGIEQRRIELKQEEQREQQGATNG